MRKKLGKTKTGLAVQTRVKVGAPCILSDDLNKCWVDREVGILE